MQCVGGVGQQVAVLVDGAALGGHVGPQRRKRPFQPGRTIGDQELRRAQPTSDEVIEDAAPRRLAFAAHVLDRQQHLLPVAAHAEHDEQRNGGRLAVEPDAHDRAVQDQAHHVLTG